MTRQLKDKISKEIFNTPPLKIERHEGVQEEFNKWYNSNNLKHHRLHGDRDLENYLMKHMPAYYIEIHKILEHFHHKPKELTWTEADDLIIEYFEHQGYSKPSKQKKIKPKKVIERGKYGGDAIKRLGGAGG